MNERFQNESKGKLEIDKKMNELLTNNSVVFELSSANAMNFDQAKIFRSIKGELFSTQSQLLKTLKKKH